MFSKVLVANRGEIAIRVQRTLREMGIRSVAIFSDMDAGALHARYADESYCLGGLGPIEAYLNGERILKIAGETGCDAIHPGYGFLSENAEFRAACDVQKCTFIGPSAHAIRVMGDKKSARACMAQSGVPIVPGGSASTPTEAAATARQIGYPVLLKAVAGGGGKGMRLVTNPASLQMAFERAQSEALKAFGDATLYIEKSLQNCRHVEVQIIGDQQGNVIHLYERDCSIQRRHQKIIEEAPCPAIAPQVLQAMVDAALHGARAIDYFSAGTFEFLLTPEMDFYFLEMNTRLQVEHPVTELTTGIDLVREMIIIALGQPLAHQQADIVRRGTSIECRLYAENPTQNFLPSPGTILELKQPSGPGVRWDSGFEKGDTVQPAYDPMIAKLSSWALSRPEAIARMQRALREATVTGLGTNLSYLQRIIGTREFTAGGYSTTFIEDQHEELLGGSLLSSEERKGLATALCVAHFHAASSKLEHRPAATRSSWQQGRDV